MPHYRLYCMSDGRIFRCEEFDADNDAGAIRKARELRGRTAAELWMDTRKVLRFEQCTPADAHPAPSG